MDLIDNLVRIGLSNREAEIYIALLQKKDFTAAELTKITNGTRSKIYEFLQNLINKGVCKESYKNGQKIYSAVNPKIAINNVITKFKNRIKQETEQMEQAGILIEKELMFLHENGIGNNDSFDYVEVLTDKGLIREKSLFIQKNTKKEIDVFTKPPYTANLDKNLTGATKTIKNKVIIRSIYEYKNLTSEEITNFIKILEMYQNVGEEVRIIYELPMKLIISDDTITMFSISDKLVLKPTITSIIVNHPAFARAHKDVFESYWQKGLTINDFKKKCYKSIKQK
jgi:HTH-type transcriptional regulator, sugar sensing transcriptional regulator